MGDVWSVVVVPRRSRWGSRRAVLFDGVRIVDAELAKNIPRAAAAELGVDLHNRWPTVGVRWVPELSLDLIVLLLALAALIAWRGKPGRAARVSRVRRAPCCWRWGAIWMSLRRP